MADHESTGRSRTAEADTKRMPPWLRRVGVVGIFLLAGAIINVMVAWGCASIRTGWWGNRTPDHRVTEARASLFRQYSGTPPNVSLMADGTLQPGKTVDWIAPSGVVMGGDQFTSVRRVRSGYPFRSMYFVEVLDWQIGTIKKITNRNDALSVGILDIGIGILPCRLLWVGFVGNSALYGVVIWVIYVQWLVGTARRRRRRKGLCPYCAYDLRGADHGKCPECGEAVR